MQSRHDFEKWFAESRHVTVEELSRRGWVSGRCTGEWGAICIPPEFDHKERTELLRDMTDVAGFGQLPPVEG